MSTKTGVRVGSVLMDQRWFQRVNKLLPWLKCGNLEERIWNFDYLAAANMFYTATDSLPFIGLNMYQKRHSGASIDRVRGFRTLQEIRNEVRELLAVSQGTTKAVVWRPTITLSLSCLGTSWKHSRDLPRHCWQDGCESTSSQTDDREVHARRLWWSWTTDQIGLRGYVLDTKFGPRYDVAKPPVLTRIRLDVSAGKCVAGMISAPRQRTSCSHKVVSVANLFHRARMLRIVEHPRDSWLGDVMQVQALAAQPRTSRLLRHSLTQSGPWRIFAFADHRAEGERCFWLGSWAAEICTVLLASVLGQVDVAVFQDEKIFIRRRPHHAQSFIHHVTTPVLPFCLSRCP